MGGYVCKTCGAVLDFGEKCRCEYSSEVEEDFRKAPGKKDSYQLVRVEVRDGKAYAVVR